MLIEAVEKLKIVASEEQIYALCTIKWGKKWIAKCRFGKWKLFEFSFHSSYWIVSFSFMGVSNVEFLSYVMDFCLNTRSWLFSCMCFFGCVDTGHDFLLTTIVSVEEEEEETLRPRGRWVLKFLELVRVDAALPH